MRLNIRTPTQAKDAVKKASAKKSASIETIDEAWARIFAMKNSDADRRKLDEVKIAMESGKIGREPESVKDREGNSTVPKRFSKAEALRLYMLLAEQQREGKLKELVANTLANYILVDTIEKMASMADDIRASDVIAFDCETYDGKGPKGSALDPWQGDVAGFSISTRNYNYYVPIDHTEKTALNTYPVKDVLGIVATALLTTKIVMHNAPFDCKWFSVKYGLDLHDALHADTRIMAMSLDENRSHRLKDLLTDWLREPSDNFDELFPNTQFNEVPLDVALVYAAGDTEKTLKLYDWVMHWYDKREDLRAIKRLFYEVEMPVARQFIRSDLRGIRFDVEGAVDLDKKLEKEEEGLQAEIYGLAGKELNLNSPTQLSRLLFEELRLPNLGKGSTNSRFMNRIKNEHPIVQLILDYKEIGKLRSSFTQKLPKDVKSDGKIHPWHNSWGAATGRFTCSNPNTQQIPAKRPEIRYLFKATADDRVLVSMDYSQIELRVLAHMADEKVLIEAFEQGRDIHSTTAALISKGRYTYEEIERDKETGGHPCAKLRKQAKIVNFGIVYGMGASKLADTLEITPKEAQEIIDNYFAGYPGIKRYMDEQHAKVAKQGYVTDFAGRKRRLHEDIKASKKDRWRLFSAQRQAGNFPIQAGAGTILKKAIVDLQEVMTRHDVYILLQVHDELVYDCPANITDEALQEIQWTMENAVKLKVPVRCDIEINPRRWAEKGDLS